MSERLGLQLELERRRRQVKELRRQRALLRRLVPFARQALTDFCQGRFWCDADLQNYLEAHGLIQPYTVVEPCGAPCCACEPDDVCYRVVDEARPFLGVA